MSRHRNAMRKVSICDDDYDDDIAQSYDETYGVSPGTSDMYTFNRNKECTSLSQFMESGQKIVEESEYEDPNLDEMAAAALGGGRTDGTQKSKLNEEFMFDMDNQTANSFFAQKKIASSTIIEIPSDGMPKRSASKPMIINESHLSSPKSQKKPPTLNNKPIKQQLDQLSKNNLAPKPSISSGLGEMKISASTENFKKLVNPVDKEKLLKAYEEYTAGKDVINLIIIGHVDAGKSTLMGHVLYQLGQVSNKLMHRYKQESQKIGKSSFAYAWVLDETEEERNRGVTIDIAQTKFETDAKIINLLDAPGHRDFIPNMITGAGQADCAILVINSVKGEFETGFEQGGQTREHSLLVKSLGVTQVIIAVNKMDMCDWSKERFLEICLKLGSFLTKQVGFKESDITFVPCSGLNGENLTKPSTSPTLTAWYNQASLAADTDSKISIKAQTLLEAINNLKPREKPIDKPLRFCISDVFKNAQSSAISLAGKMEAGSVSTGDRVCIVPANEIGMVKSISLTNDVPLTQCFAGDSVILNVSSIDPQNVYIGNVVCDCISPAMPVSDKLRAKIVLFNLDKPLIKGFPVVFHYKSMNEAAVIKKIVSQLDKSSGEVVKEKPRFLTKGMSAIVEIKINRPLCMELFQNYRELGRFMLRYGSSTIAAGLITEIL